MNPLLPGAKTAQTHGRIMTYSKLRWVLLAHLHLAMIALGIHMIARIRYTSADVIFSQVPAFVAVLTCVNDARAARRPIPHGLQLIMLIIWPLSAAVYLVWSRKWWGLLAAIVLASSLFLCFAVAAATMLVFTEFVP